MILRISMIYVILTSNFNHGNLKIISNHSSDTINHSSDTNHSLDNLLTINQSSR